MQQLTQIYRYPIKSSMPISLEESVVENRGLAFDRLWCVFDKDNQALTAREFPALLDIEARVTGEELLICYEGKTAAKAPLAPSAEDSRSVKVFNYDVAAVPTNPAVNEWFSNFLGIECQLLFQHEALQRSVLQKHGGVSGEVVGFADQCPVLLATEASLADLNDKIGRPLLMNRFRPNLVVNGTGAWAEDEWKKIRIGECEFKVNQACIRCVLTTIDPISKAKEPDSEPLRTMNSFRKGPVGGVVFGMHITPLNTGKIKLNDELVVLN